MGRALRLDGRPPGEPDLSGLGPSVRRRSAFGGGGLRRVAATEPLLRVGAGSGLVGMDPRRCSAARGRERGRPRGARLRGALRKADAVWLAVDERRLDAGSAAARTTATPRGRWRRPHRARQMYEQRTGSPRPGCRGGRSSATLCWRSTGTPRPSSSPRRSSSWRAGGARHGRSASRCGRSRGREKRARGAASEAIEVLEASEARLELAAALVDLGAEMRRRNRKSGSREPLMRGMDLAHDCGRRAARRSRPHRAARVGHAGPPHALFGPESLTDCERRVADLAVAGQHEPRDRRRALRHGEDRRGASLQHLPQARYRRPPAARSRRYARLMGPSCRSRRRARLPGSSPTWRSSCSRPSSATSCSNASASPR